MNNKLLKFSATWCGPCKTLTKTLHEMGVEYSEVDADMQPELISKYGVRGVPTLLIVDQDGKEVSKTRLVGAKTAPEIEGWLAVNK